MKKTFAFPCFVLCLLFLISAAFAQRGLIDAEEPPPPRPLPMIGAFGGVNFAFISVDPNEGLDLQMRPRPIAGAAWLLPLRNPKNQLQLELAYIGKGVKNSFGDTTETILLDYLCVSPMLHLNVGKQPGFFLRAGPEVGWLFQSKLTVDAAGEKSDVDTKEFYSNFDVGFKVGAGFNLRLMRRLHSQMNVTYSIGLVDILTGKNTGDIFYVTRGLQIHAGFFIPLRMKHKTEDTR